ncbi:MAG TPA: adenylate/guanylate cyclase domain-containing protein [Nocardioidaceae bacterium]|nr:adenylate/guanylate cyclase domain-containing protein [Nocardioidaceae bacterium]
MDLFEGELLASTAIGLIGVGMGVVLLVCQHPSRTSLSISAWCVSLGLLILTGLPLLDGVDPSNPGLWVRLQVVFETGLILASSSYMMGLLETAHASPRADRFIRLTIKSGYAMAGIGAVLAAVFPAERWNEYLLSVTEPDFFTSDGFRIFAGYYLVVGTVFALAWLSLSRQDIDPSEKARATMAALSSILLSCVTLLPLAPAMIACCLILMLMLYGQFRYFVAQGERGAFLSRFLSPQVANLVRGDGLATVTRPAEVEVTVVACDLRGFTSYAEAVPSQAVIDLLNEYYEAVGTAVAEVDGTIKDYAGDGIMILVGAPLRRDDHAAAGLRLASRLHEVCGPVLDHWATPVHPLSLGAGVASGRVTVGAIGSAARMEFTAVGTAVNLAARLCSAAAPGQTLIDAHTYELAGMTGVAPHSSMQLKGLASDHMVYGVDRPIPS